MRRRRVLPLILVAAFGVLSEGVATWGWWRWVQLANELGEAPRGGAETMARAGTWVVPSTIWWSRHLEDRDLGQAPTELVVTALEELATAQSRWFPADPHGAENRARALLIDGQLEAGRAALEAAVVRDPTSPYLHRLLALLLRRSGNMEEARRHLIEAEAIRRGFAVPPIELAADEQENVRLAGLRRHLELYPRQRVAGVMALAAGLRDVGEMNEALDVLTEIEDHPEVRLMLAGWAFDDARYGAATRMALEVAEKGGGLPASIRGTAWALAARAADLNGDPALAERAAAQALRINPGSPAPYLALAEVAERRGDLVEALRHLRHAWGIAPGDVQVLLRLSATAEKAGHQADARLALERAVELRPDDPALATRLVDYYLRSGDFMAAALRLSRALERFPEHPGLLRQAESLRRKTTR